MGKRVGLKRADLLDYFGKERLGLSEKLIEKEIETFEAAYPIWQGLLQNSFLSPKLQTDYLALLQERRKRLLT